MQKSKKTALQTSEHRCFRLWQM